MFRVHLLVVIECISTGRRMFAKFRCSVSGLRCISLPRTIIIRSIRMMPVQVVRQNLVALGEVSVLLVGENHLNLVGNLVRKRVIPHVVNMLQTVLLHHGHFVLADKVMVLHTGNSVPPRRATGD